MINNEDKDAILYKYNYFMIFNEFLDQHMKRPTSGRKIINKIIKDVRGMNVEKEMQKTKSGKN